MISSGEPGPNQTASIIAAPPPARAMTPSPMVLSSPRRLTARWAISVPVTKPSTTKENTMLKPITLRP